MHRLRSVVVCVHVAMFGACAWRRVCVPVCCVHGVESMTTRRVPVCVCALSLSVCARVVVASLYVKVLGVVACCIRGIESTSVHRLLVGGCNVDGTSRA